jgi:type IX secretion system PorP/SprF family membrane protein
MKKSLIIIMVLMLPLCAAGQTDIQMSQHMFNRTTYNPASTGASQYVNIYGHWRDQWQGFTGAPQTMLLTAHAYFSELKSGLGIVAINDKLGFERNMLFKLSYAYHLHITPGAYISFGLSGGVLNRNIDWTKKILREDVDPGDDGYVQDKQENKWSADVDFGIEFNMEKFTVGVSVTHLNTTANKATDTDMGHHFYGYIKYRFPLGVDFDLVPALFAQNSKKSTHMESNFVLFYRNKAWFGASYRVDDSFKSESVVGMAGIDLMGWLRLGYSFDYNIGAIGKSASNTHEIMLGIRLSRPQRIFARSPRFFE